MSKRGGALDKIESTEQIINRIYATAFRLTGKRHSAEALASEAIKAVLGKKEIVTMQAALKGLCNSFLNNPPPVLLEDFKIKKNNPRRQAVDAKQVQQALLCLEPVERLVLVLREMWQFSYGDISNLTGLEQDKVAKVLAQGRVGLRNCFFPAVDSG